MTENTLLRNLQKKFGLWVYSYLFDSKLEFVRLYSKDRRKVQVIPSEELPACWD